MFPLVCYIVTGLIGAPLEVRVAPDQPAPVFFTDEPLLLELTAADAVRCATALYVELPDGTAVSEPLDMPGLNPGVPRWLAADLPRLRGAYHVYVTAECPSETVQARQTVVRVDRPTGGGVTQLGVTVDSWSETIAYGVRCMAAGAVRFDVGMPELPKHVDAASRIAGCRVHVRVSAESMGVGAGIGRIAGAIADRVDVWEISGVAGPHDFATLAASVRDVAFNARLALVVTRPQEIPAYLASGEPSFPDAFVLAGPEPGANGLEPFIRAIERAGYERLPIILDLSGLSDTGPEAIRSHALLDSARGALQTVFLPQHWLFGDDGFTRHYAECAWAGAALHGAAPLGALDTPGNYDAWLARLAPGNATGDWLLGVRTGPEVASSIDPGADVPYEVMDAYGNPVPHEPGHERNIVLPSGGFWFVRGTGGTLVERRLVSRVQSASQAILTDETLSQNLPPEAAGALAVLNDYSYPAPVRFEFFALLRSLPALEDRWHRGVLDTRIAVPLIKRLGRIAEDLAVLEEDLGEAFLEPLEKTLASCSEWLDRYPEAEISTPLRDRRVAFLREEVARLMAEARAWQEAGRSTEAKALAALAEWRARCLAPAATAKRMPEPEPGEDPEAAPESEDKPDPEDDA